MNARGIPPAMEQVRRVPPSSPDGGVSHPVLVEVFPSNPDGGGVVSMGVPHTVLT